MNSKIVSIKSAMQNRKRIFIFLWIGCILGQWALLPYLHFAGVAPASTAALLVSSLIQTPLLWGVICWLSYILLKRVDLQPFPSTNPRQNTVDPGIFWGLVIGMTLLALSKWVFSASPLTQMHLPAWTGALASIYGAINEEVLMRLFLLTLLYFLLRKMFKKTERTKLLWAAILVMALIFGISHFALASKLASLSSFEVIRILVLNGIPGIIFGWLYCFRSLWAAMLAHFIADIIIHVLMA